MSQLQLSKSTADPLASLRIDRSDRGPKRKSRIGRIVVLLLFIALIAGGAYAWTQFGEVLMRAEVRVATVETRTPGTADSVLTAQGYLKSRTQAAIGAKVAGRVSKIYVEEGESVPPSAKLAELEHTDMEALLKATEATLQATMASLTAMEVSVDKARAERDEAQTTLDQDDRDLQLAKDLLDRRAGSAIAHERAKTKRNASEDRVRSLDAGLRLAAARFAEAKAHQLEAAARVVEMKEQIENFIVKAPPLPDGADPEQFRWTVISKEAEVGESITPGGMGAASGRGSVVTLANLLNLEVETDVKEDYLGRVRVGQQVEVAVDGVPDRRFTGSVRTIIPMGDRAKGTVKVKVKLTDSEVKEVNDLVAKRFTLFPEMAASVHFMSEGKEASGGIVELQHYAPAAAILQNEDGKFAWQVVGDRLKRVSVETGDAREGRVLIQRGLKGGDQVVINPSATLKENQLIKTAQ